MPAPMMTALARGGKPPRPPEAVLARGGDPPEPPDGLTAPVTSSPGPWPLALAGVSVMPPFPCLSLQVAIRDGHGPAACTTAAGPVPRCASPGATLEPPGGRDDAASYSTGISLLIRPRSIPCRLRMTRAAT